LKKLFKKLLPIKICACAYIARRDAVQNCFQINYEVKIFTKQHKSGLKKIDIRLNNNKKCYAVFDNGLLVHESWVFKKKLLATQLALRDAHIVGDSYTIPTYQQKGIYTNLLKLIISQSDKDIVIFVSPENIASVKAIERTGFIKLFKFELLRFSGFKIRLKKHENKN
jgi:hypothetical protein